MTEDAPSGGARAARAAEEPAPRRRRVPIWALGLAGALLGAAYAGLVERMHVGPPFVMLALGGMTLALAGAALVRVIDPLTGGALSAALPRGNRRRRELEREKQLVLKAIKEIELDYQMRKIAERDYREMVERYRARAMRLMTEIEAGDDYRALIERELALRLKLGPGKAAGEGLPAPQASAPGAAAPARRACPGCATVNDPDAQFCKQCGNRL